MTLKDNKNINEIEIAQSYLEKVVVAGEQKLSKAIPFNLSHLENIKLVELDYAGDFQFYGQNELTKIEESLDEILEEQESKLRENAIEYKSFIADATELKSRHSSFRINNLTAAVYLLQLS